MQDSICPRIISLGSMFGFGTNTQDVPVVAELPDPNRAEHEPQNLLEGDEDL
jgi:hypothetical protein